VPVELGKPALRRAKTGGVAIGIGHGARSPWRGPTEAADRAWMKTSGLAVQ
jgi:hypothetical protein